MAVKHQQISDQIICEEALQRINGDKTVASPDLQVDVAGGVVTLTGHVETKAARLAAGSYAIDVDGVRAVANNLEVRPAYRRNDTEIARDVLRALKTNVCVPAEHIKAAILDGRVALQGTVHWEVQKMMAEAAVRRLHGITGVVNHIVVRPDVEEDEVRDGAVAVAEDTASFYENLGAID